MTAALLPLHRNFGIVNRWLVLPAFRLGMGGFFSTPFTGSMMVLRTTGRTTGRRREAPLGYYIADGVVYCAAGFGPGTQWYRNLVADPRVEVVLPGLAFAGTAETVTDATEWRRIFPPYLASLGVIGRLTLGDLGDATPERLERIQTTLPLVCIRPAGVAPGPSDPGGWQWIVVQGAWLLVLAAFARVLARRIRRTSRTTSAGR